MKSVGRSVDPILDETRYEIDSGELKTTMTNPSSFIHPLKRESGFTLIEIIAVLAIIGIMATVAIPKFIDVGLSSEKRAIHTGVAELNSRDANLWAKVKISGAGWVSDEHLFSQLDTELGSVYKWSPSAAIDGGILHFNDQMIKLKRTASTDAYPGRWEIIFES